MKFIEALKLRSKLFFLFILITLGLVSVGVMGFTHINAMKKKYGRSVLWLLDPSGGAQ